MEKFGIFRVAEDNIIRHMCLMWWIPKATNTQLELIFHSNDDYATTPRYYVDTYIAFLVQFFFGTENFDSCGNKLKIKHLLKKSKMRVEIFFGVLAILSVSDTTCRLQQELKRIGIRKLK